MRKYFNQPFYVYLCLFLIAVLVVLRVFLGFDGLYSQDSYEYLRYSKAIKSWLLGGDHPGNYFWASLYSFLGAILSLSTLEATLSLQVLSVIGGAILVLYTSKIIHLLNLSVNLSFIRVYVVLGLLFSPYLFRMIFCSMTDTLSISIMVSSLYYILKYDKNRASKSLFISVVLSAVAFNIRYASGIALFLPILSVLVLGLKDKKYAVVLVSLLFSLSIFIPHYILKSNESFSLFSQQSLSEWSVLNFFKSTHVTQFDGTITYPFINLVKILEVFYHPGFVFFGPLLFFFIRSIKTNFPQKVLLTSLVVYLLFIAGMNLQNQRFLLTALPIVIILLFPAYKHFIVWFKTKFSIKYLIIGITVIQFVLLLMAMKPFVLMNSNNKKIVEVIDVIQGVKVYTLGMEGALRTYGQREVISLWGMDKERLSQNSLIVINENTIEQFELNHQLFPVFYDYKSREKLSLVKKVSGDWSVYRVNK